MSSEAHILNDNRAKLDSVKEPKPSIPKPSSDLNLMKNRNSPNRQKTFQVNSNTDFSLKIMKIEG